MSLQSFASELESPCPDTDTPDQRPPPGRDDLAGELQAALAREQALICSLEVMRDRHELLTQEANHRLLNGVQSIASLLSAQSRRAPPEVAAQLTAAVSRIVAFGQVNRRLHLLDHQDYVEFSGYLAELCADLTALLVWQQSGFAISIDATALDMPTRVAIPLSYVVNELITNSVKYAAATSRSALRRGPAAIR